MLARAGADEFLVMLPETEADASLDAFERILLELEQPRVGPVETISASVGVAGWT